MLKAGPTADKASDDYTAARMRLATLRTKLRDNTDTTKRLALVEKRREAKVTESELDRRHGTQAVASEENTLREAQKLAKHARHLERLSREERSASEKAEAQGLALQRPAAALLKDSQRLNDQSNLVLDQSHSAQAKALAALDLKLAQSLAARASKGMAEARGDFALAIADRKKAVNDDTQSAHKVTEDASVSLKTNQEQPALLHVLHGQVTGGQALSAVVNTDTKGLMNAEEALGVDRDALIAEKKSVADADAQLAVLADQAKALRAEVQAAEKEVLQAAHAHVAALRAYKMDTAKALSSQTQLNSLRQQDMKTLRDQRTAVATKMKDSSQRYKDALAKIAKLDGHQTVLKVEIARLRLQLKEAEMQRREARDKASHEQDTINNMQAQLDKEDADLNEARLRIADTHLQYDKTDASDEGSPDRVHALAAAALDAAEPARRHAGGLAAARRGREDEAAEPSYDPSHMRESLDQQRRDDARLAEREAAAHRRARAEEAKLKAAQQQVASQLSKITNLESSMD
eukprot:Tamp_01802.p1 GENE.Tamp_01802~~Tamp_01802.p1  ORF type:complete len:521 (+),score=204.92 Tamp_01802:350-1912(+)